jgi:hypothetical protein
MRVVAKQFAEADEDGDIRSDIARGIVPRAVVAVHRGTGRMLHREVREGDFRSFFDRWLGWDQRLELLDECRDVVGHDAPDDVIVHFIIIMGEDCGAWP